MAGQFGWLASYTRSSNTWVRLMLNLLTHNRAELDINDLELSTPIASHRELDALCYSVPSAELTEDEIAELQPLMHRGLAEKSDQPLLLRKVHD